jgi:3-hydroxyisobutyrate dehydrogenase-like beta-hydroxyacid dehydrogenase
VPGPQPEAAARPRVVAVLGTGIMGGPMARNMAAAGHAVRVWNRSPAKAEALADAGIASFPTPSAACEGADACLVMLSDGPTCDAVLFRPDETGRTPAQALAAGAVVIVSSSIPVETARAQAARCAEAGLRYADAPVSGGDVGAKAATLAIMVGAEPETYSQIAPLLSSMGRPTRIGPPGTGSLAKLCNQMIVGITIGAVAEAVLLARAGGADPDAVRTALMGGFAGSRILEVHGRRMAVGDWVPGGPSKYQLKDMRTAAGFAASNGLDLPLTRLVEELYQALCIEGDAELDHSALIREIARRTGRPALAEP